ncbi:hypothetical protein PR048_012402 [Dryococelus australis]|uniref:Uncharacterized protein n=1 Tax=Dryococelus australis TaxID=614101 RepID=A0ABQ9HQM5_9NEOP|nr:hypothetical protein PR048_012402 [Dryococelus australis]
MTLLLNTCAGAGHHGAFSRMTSEVPIKMLRRVNGLRREGHLTSTAPWPEVIPHIVPAKTSECTTASWSSTCVTEPVPCERLSLCRIEEESVESKRQYAITAILDCVLQPCTKANQCQHQQQFRKNHNCCTPVKSCIKWLVQQLRHALTFHQGEPGSIAGWVTGFSQEEIMPGEPIFGGFSWGSPISPVPSFRRHSIFTSITLFGSEDLTFMCCPNLFTLFPRLGLCGISMTDGCETTKLENAQPCRILKAHFRQRVCRPYLDCVSVMSLDAEFRTHPRTQEWPVVRQALSIWSLWDAMYASTRRIIDSLTLSNLHGLFPNSVTGYTDTLFMGLHIRNWHCIHNTFQMPH